ncbi:MAG: hypothetical protein O3A55_07235 [Bacteroidetes bacterium]|nr:hypothetical protein [Bacteroidota bacterium]
MKLNSAAYNLLFGKLKRAAKLYYAEKVFIVLLQLVIFLSVIILIFSFIETFFQLSSLWRGIIFWSTITFCIVFLFYKTYKFILEWKKEKVNLFGSIALLIGEKFPIIKDHLRNVLQIFEQNSPYTSSEITLFALEELEKETSSLNYSEAISFLSFKRIAKTASYIVVISILILSFSGIGLSSALYRIVNYDQSFKLADKYLIKVSPNNLDVVKGDTIPVSVFVNLNPAHTKPNITIPNKIKFITFLNLDGDKEEIIIEKKNVKYEAEISNIRSSTYFYIQVENQRTPTYKINVTDKPLIRLLSVEVTPPKYTNEESFTLPENVGDVSALKGSAINLKIQTNKNLSEASILFEKYSKKMKKNKSSFNYNFILNENDNYTFKLISDEGIKNEHKINYLLVSLKDQNPTVEIILPKEESVADQTMKIPIELEVWDDYEIINCKIGIKLIRSDFENKWKNSKFISVPLTSAKKREPFSINFLMDLTGYSFAPNDVVEYFAEATDNDQVTGPKTTRSKTHIIRFPSLDEVFSEVQKKQETIQSSLEQNVKEAEQITKVMKELLREVKQQKDINNKQKENIIEALKKKMSDLEEKTKSINDELSKVADNLQKEQLLSSETLEKYFELQELMKNLNLEEYQKAIQKLQDKMKGLNQEQLNQIIPKIELNDEIFRSSLERTINLLKRIQIEQKLDELVKRSEELLKKQAELEKETSSNNKSKEDLKQKQNQIEKELNNLKKQTKDLESKMEEFASEMPMKELDETKESLESDDLKKEMDESIKNLSNSQMEQSAVNQKKLIKEFQKLGKQFSNLKEELLRSQSNQVLSTMQRAIEDLIELSKRQEKIKKETEQLETNSSQFPEKAKEELSLESNLQSLMESLAQASQKSFKITPQMGRTLGEALREIINSVSALEQRNNSNAFQNQNNAMSLLNKSANQIQKAISEMAQQSQGGGFSFLQQFRQLMGEQQLLNLETEGMMNGKGYTKEQIESIGKMSAQQEMIRKSLEQLSKEAAESEIKQKMIGNTQSILDEMKEVVKELSDDKINESTIEKQKNILSRMLDMQRSTQERDYEERRKAISATDKNFEKTESVEIKQLRKKKIDLLQLRDSKFTKEYKELIRSYYEQLQKEEIN